MTVATPVDSADPTDPLAPARLDEAAARRVLLVQAVEDGDPPASLWSPEDAAWASRLAGETAVLAGGSDAPPARWLQERARHACERLLPRDAALAVSTSPPRLGRWCVAVAAGAFVIGLAADSLVGGQRIDLLAPPWLALLAWNLGVMAALLIGALRRRGAPPASGLRGAMGRLLQRLPQLPRTSGHGGSAAAVARFAHRWGERAAALTAARGALLVHTAAAALALGLVAGLYLRGLVLDFRAGWQSTFLDAGAVHALLAAVLGPASALTGIALPGVDGVAALRVGAGAAAATVTTATAPAADWIHLLAATLVLAVVLPRALLAAVAAARAAWLARRIELPLADPYFARLLAASRRVAPQVQALPHGAAPGAAAALGLRALLAATLGPLDDARGLRLEAPVRYGDEDGAPPGPPPGTTLRLALVDLAATPEAEAHGRWLQTLRAASPLPLVLLADESAWQRRFGTLPARTAERRAAWQALAAAHGIGFAAAPLENAAAEPASMAEALQQALQRAPRAPSAAGAR